MTPLEKAHEGAWRILNAPDNTGGVSDMLRAFGDKLRSMGLRPGGRR